MLTLLLLPTQTCENRLMPHPFLVFVQEQYINFEA